MTAMNPTLKNWLAFFFGLGAVTQIRIVGAMALTEAFCIVLAPFVLVNIWPRFKEAKGHKILLLLFLWMVSAIITDLYRETETKDALKGIFALPFLGAVFIIAFALLWDDLMRVRWIAFGMAISGIISLYAFHAQSVIGRAESMGAALTEVMNFKTYYAGIVFLVISALVALLFHNWPRLTVWILLASSTVFLYGGSRSGFLVLLLGAGGTWLAQNRFLSLRAIQRNTVMIVIFAAIGGLIAMETYAYAVNRGWLGEEEERKYEEQTDSEIGILEGRADFIGALLAIKDSPIIGYGSWAKDERNYMAQTMRYIGDEESARMAYRRSMMRKVGMPTHSHLGQAWVWHGFLGGLFWIFILVLMIRFFKYAIHLCRPLIAYFILLLTTSGWDLFFSPFSQRPRWGVVFAVMILSLAEVERRRKKVSLTSTKFDEGERWDGKWERILTEGEK